MSPILLHIYGPFAIHSFGLMIVIGLIVTLYVVHQDIPLKKIIDNQQLVNFVNISLISGIMGGRIWFLMTNSSQLHDWTEYFMVWNGGLSILGAIIGAVTGLSLYIIQQKLPLLPILDRVAIYVPLLQSISRLGCFFAGCCYGLPTDVPWAIIYQDIDSLAPLHIALHPTQIYSSIALLIIFICLYLLDHYNVYRRPGQIAALYIILVTAERFMLEFWRGDQIICPQSYYFTILSVQQLLALSLCIIASIMLIFFTLQKKDESI